MRVNISLFVSELQKQLSLFDNFIVNITEIEKNIVYVSQVILEKDFALGSWEEYLTCKIDVVKVDVNDMQIKYAFYEDTCSYRSCECSTGYKEGEEEEYFWDNWNNIVGSLEWKNLEQIQENSLSYDLKSVIDMMKECMIKAKN